MNITAYEHIGTRVSNRERALAFYQSLGFLMELEDGSDAIELINNSGVRINLIVNADQDHCRSNVLLDEPIKRPGHTHIAFVVSSLEDSVAYVTRLGIRITEGPKQADRRPDQAGVAPEPGSVAQFPVANRRSL
jgi:catechol 2,3-dioxygenase-like lactoylglutathione lyase family enzyme